MVENCPFQCKYLEVWKQNQNTNMLEKTTRMKKSYSSVSLFHHHEDFLSGITRFGKDAATFWASSRIAG